MIPANRQHYLLFFEERMGEGLHFFPCRDFLLLYSRAKCYASGISSGLPGNSIGIVLQIITKSLFLFYGKRLLFCCGCAMHRISTYIFHYKDSKYIDSYFNMQEGNSPIPVGNPEPTEKRTFISVGNSEPTEKRTSIPVGNSDTREKRTSIPVGNPEPMEKRTSIPVRKSVAADWLTGNSFPSFSFLFCKFLLLIL